MTIYAMAFGKDMTNGKDCFAPDIITIPEGIKTTFADILVQYDAQNQALHDPKPDGFWLLDEAAKVVIDTAMDDEYAREDLVAVQHRIAKKLASVLTHGVLTHGCVLFKAQ